jgi:hypothetical protein
MSNTKISPQLATLDGPVIASSALCCENVLYLRYKVLHRCTHRVPYALLGFDRISPHTARVEVADVYTRFCFSCRQCQVQRFVEQQQISLKWITQGLSNSGRRRSKLSLSSNPAIMIQKVSCVPSTPNTLVRCIGALVRRRDSEIQVVVMIMSSKCNMK